MSRWMRESELLEIFAISRTTFRRWLAKEGFPKGKALSKRCRRWTVEEVESWADSRACWTPGALNQGLKAFCETTQRPFPRKKKPATVDRSRGLNDIYDGDNQHAQHTTKAKIPI